MTYRRLGAVGTFPYPIIDSVITGIIVSIKHGNGAPGTLAQFNSGFELVIDAGDISKGKPPIALVNRTHLRLVKAA